MCVSNTTIQSNLTRLDPACFTQYLWEGGSIQRMFGFSLRYRELERHKGLMNAHAVGWCYGYELFVRVKPNEIAVMFEIGGIRWWNHLRRDEFLMIFC